LGVARVRAAEISIPKGKKFKNKRMNPLANWNENCKNVVTKARNAMHNNKTLGNYCINYRRLNHHYY